VYRKGCRHYQLSRRSLTSQWIFLTFSQTQLGQIDSQFCPTVAPTSWPSFQPIPLVVTDSPTFPSTPSPTRHPTNTPTDEPTGSLIQDPVEQPTQRPSGPSTFPLTLGPSKQPMPSETDKPTIQPHIAVVPSSTPAGAPSTTSEATIEPSGVANSNLPTIISQFPTIDMSMSMKLNFLWANEDFRSLLLEQEERMDSLREYGIK
jgi:hypothetical protein